jgi:hypothetical protein
MGGPDPSKARLEQELLLPGELCQKCGQLREVSSVVCHSVLVTNHVESPHAYVGGSQVQGAIVSDHQAFERVDFDTTRRFSVVFGMRFGGAAALVRRDRVHIQIIEPCPGESMFDRCQGKDRVR